MPIPATQYIWFNGKLVPWEKATVHVLSHALHYGSSAEEEEWRVAQRGSALAV
jgi:branched-chain amino acid aminotransferase